MNKEDTVKEQVIEMIAKRIFGHYHPDIKWGHFDKHETVYSFEKQCLDLVKELLDLCYPCAECKGLGQKNISDNDYTQGIYVCPTCHGTGKGSKVLAILDPDQTLPVNPYLGDIDIFNNIRLATRQGYDKAQQDMITPKDGKVWRKTVETNTWKFLGRLLADAMRRGNQR